MRYGKRQSTNLNRKRDYEDLVVMFVGACILIGAVLLFGCTGESVTSPAPLDPTVPAVSEAAIVAPTPVTPTSTTGGSVHIWATGNIDVTGPVKKQACYFEFGPHEQHLLAEYTIDVPAGSTWVYKRPAGLKDVCIQVDVADSCAKSSIMPGLIADLRIGSCPKPEPSPTPSPEPTPEPSPTPSPEPTPTPPPPPTPACHVSNVGHPAGDINLQVTYKSDGAGHLKRHCADFVPVTFTFSCNDKVCKSHDRRCPCDVAIKSWKACHE